MIHVNSIDAFYFVFKNFFTGLTFNAHYYITTTPYKTKYIYPSFAFGYIF